MKNTVILTIAGAGALLSNPVLAKDAPSRAETAVASSSNGVAVRPTRYCTEFLITGSIIPRKICRTRDQWLATGVDPIEK